MKIKYLGPSPEVNIEPYGPHRKDEAKDYPDDFGQELLATSKRQKFEEIIEAPDKAESFIETFQEVAKEITKTPAEMVKGVLDAMGVPEDKIDTASFKPEKEPESVKPKPEPEKPEKKVVPRIEIPKPKKRNRRKK